MRICNPLKPLRLVVSKQGIVNRITNPYNKNRRIANPPKYAIRICNPLKPLRLVVNKQGIVNRITNPYNKNRRIANPTER